MIADRKRSPIASDPIKPESISVSIPVIVTAGDPPSISFQGVGPQNSIRVDHETATFSLTLSTVGFQESDIVTFDPQEPILWLTPGAEQTIGQPVFITNFDLNDTSTVITFTDTNTATPNDEVLISFRVQALINGNPFTLATSPDPTIINVDPPPGGDVDPGEG